MISPSYIISASHYPPSGNIRFYDTNDPNGPYEVRTIVASEWLSVAIPGDNSDIWIGKLNQPLSSADTYPILTLPQASDYQGLSIDTFGMSDVPAGVGGDGNATTERLGRNVISWATSTSYSSGTQPTNGPYQFNYTYSNPGIGPDESYLMPGDSGGPSFFLYGGAKPALVGVHWFTSTTGMGTPYSADSFLSPYVGDIQTGMNQLATLTGTASESLTTESPIKGDFNLDGRLSNADISAMMVALTNVSSYETLHGMNTAYLNYVGDINGDGLVNNADLQALLTLFKSGTVSTDIVPEPAAWLPLMLGGTGLLAWQVLARRK